MSIDSSAAAGQGRMETRTIDMVPEHERHGSPSSQFTLWFGANMQITAVVDGALAVVFGAEAMTAILGGTDTDTALAEAQSTVEFAQGV